MSIITSSEEKNKYSLKNFELLTENNKKIILGEGSFAKVYKAKNKIDKKFYGIKAVK